MISGIVKALKGAGSGYWMALPALLAIVAYPLAFATYYSLQRILPGHPARGPRVAPGPRPTATHARACDHDRLERFSE